MRFYDNTFYVSAYGVVRPSTGLLWISQFYRLWGGRWKGESSPAKERS